MASPADECLQAEWGSRILWALYEAHMTMEAVHDDRWREVSWRLLTQCLRADELAARLHAYSDGVTAFKPCNPEASLDTVEKLWAGIV